MNDERATRHELAEEAALLGRIASDVEAFETVYRRYVRRVSAFAARRCDSAEDAADVVARTFVRLLRHAHRYDAARGTVSAFVFAIARSEAADARRRTRRDRTLVDRVAGRRLLERDDIARMDDAMDAARATAELAEVLAQLPPSEREVLHLVTEGLSASEAATRLDITPEAARTRLARARHRVRSRRGSDVADASPVPPGRPPSPATRLQEGSP